MPALISACFLEDQKGTLLCVKMAPFYMSKGIPFGVWKGSLLIHKTYAFWKAKPAPFNSQKACCLMWTSGTGLPARRLRALSDLLHNLSASSWQLHTINGIDNCDEAEAGLKRFLLLEVCEQGNAGIDGFPVVRQGYWRKVAPLPAVERGRGKLLTLARMLVRMTVSPQVVSPFTQTKHIMATPNHIPDMEPLDRLTVALYRSGISLFALVLLLEAVELLADISILGQWHLPLTAAAAAVASANIHLYDPMFRWLFPLMSWLGLIVLAFSMPAQSPAAKEALSVLSLAFFYAGASMFAVKEYFCFRIPGLPLMPLLLGAAVLLRWGGMNAAEGVFLSFAGLLYAWLAVAKWKMPLHFDIGDKSMYKI